MLGTNFIIFGTITRLLLNMLNVKRKQNLGKCGKPVTENISTRETPRRHETLAPSPTAKNTVRGVALKRNTTVTLLSLFLYLQAKDHKVILLS